MGKQFGILQRSVARTGLARMFFTSLAFSALLFSGFESNAAEPRYGEYAFDNSISNQFWCTWGWVAPAPAQGESSAVAPFDFSGTVCSSSSAVVPFHRSLRKSITISFR